MKFDYKRGDRVRRRTDGVPMIIIGPKRLRSSADWECAWMDGHLRHTDEFSSVELEPLEEFVVSEGAQERATEFLKGRESK